MACAQIMEQRHAVAASKNLDNWLCPTYNGPCPSLTLTVQALNYDVGASLQMTMTTPDNA